MCIGPYLRAFMCNRQNLWLALRRNSTEAEEMTYFLYKREIYLYIFSVWEPLDCCIAISCLKHVTSAALQQQNVNVAQNVNSVSKIVMSECYILWTYW